jgi:hypothetical protein
MRSRATRYSIQCPVKYAFQRGDASTSGEGHTVNISNGGVLFQSEEKLTVGGRIELVVRLADRDDTDTVVTLFADGVTVRSDGGSTAMAIKRHRLRPVRSPETKLR